MKYLPCKTYIPQRDYCFINEVLLPLALLIELLIGLVIANY